MVLSIYLFLKLFSYWRHFLMQQSILRVSLVDYLHSFFSKWKKHQLFIYLLLCSTCELRKGYSWTKGRSWEVWVENIFMGWVFRSGELLSIYHVIITLFPTICKFDLNTILDRLTLGIMCLVVFLIRVFDVCLRGMIRVLIFLWKRKPTSVQ